MIQQGQHSQWYLLLLRRSALAATLHAGLACGVAAPHGPIPRTLEGHTQLSSFVPPFAYEAYIRGELALARGDFDDAAAHFELATAAPEEDPYLLARLAWAQARAGRAQEAEQTLEHALALDPCSESAWFTRAELAQLAGDAAGADAAFARASECAPLSLRAPVARARALGRAGKTAAALEVLGAFSSQAEPARARVALEALLQAGSDPAQLAYALETWLAYEAPDAATLQEAALWALKHDFPSLAARIREHHRGPFSKQWDAQINKALGDREGMRILLAQSTAEELGGAGAAAEFALFAGDPERAELEATSALAGAQTDALFALRAQARFALGRSEEGLEDVRAIGDRALRRETLLALLAESGSPALARELARASSASSAPPSPGPERTQ